jgi:hypothetical protein
MKSSFNISLVEIESHIVSKNSIFDNIFGHCSVLSPYCIMGSERKTNLNFFGERKKKLQKIEKMQNELKN